MWIWWLIVYTSIILVKFIQLEIFLSGLYQFNVYHPVGNEIHWPIYEKQLSKLEIGTSTPETLSSMHENECSESEIWLSINKPYYLEVKIKMSKFNSTVNCWK